MGGLFGGGGGGTQTIVKEVSVDNSAKQKENDLKKLKEKKELQNAYGDAISTISSNALTGGKVLQDNTLSSGSLLSLSDNLGV